MVKESIIQSNRLIAEFMGGEFGLKPVFVRSGTKVLFECDGVETLDDVYENKEVVTLDEPSMWVDFPVEDLPYNKEWNWLMEAVDKIETLGYSVTITKYTTDIWGTNSDDYIVRVRGAFGKFYCADINHGKENYIGTKNLTKKETTHKAVVEFIKWYNENK